MLTCVNAPVARLIYFQLKENQMPKDEIDPEDPMEPIAVELASEEDTLAPMAECFIEEFMMMGYDQKQILGMFMDATYVGPHMVLKECGGEFIEKLIAETFRKWGRQQTQ
jgi:hypothetical protein